MIKFEREELEMLKNELVGETMTILTLSKKLINLNFEDIYNIGSLVDNILNDQTLAVADRYLIDFEVVSINSKLSDTLENKEDFELDTTLKDLELAKIKINDVSYL